MNTIVDTKIEAVAVYRDGTRVTRLGGKKIDKGEHTLVITNITGYAQDDSFRVKGRGAASLKGIDVKKKQVVFEPEGDVDKLRKELEKLIKERDTINELIAFYQSRIEWLKSIGVQFSREFGKWYSLGETSVNELTQFDENTFSRLIELKGKIRKEKRKVEEVDNKISVIQHNLNNIQGQRRTEAVTEVQVLIDAKQNTEIQLEISYQISNAGWNPVYDIDIGKGISTLKRIAMVRNNTLEDWNEVKLTVSTASSRPVTAVKPNPYYVDVAAPAYGGLGRAVEKGERKALLRDEEGDMDMLASKEELEDISMREAVITETLGGTIQYEIPGMLNIPSMNDPHPVTLVEEKFNSRKLYYWNAVDMPEVVAQDEITNGDSLILPGSVKVYADGEFIGETYMESTAPREKFRLGTRAAYDIKAEKKLVAKDTEKVGITRGKRRRDYRYRLELKSFAKEPIAIKILDRIPHSGSETVQVTLDPPTLLQNKVELGIIEWETTIEPNKELKIEYGFIVEWEKNLQIRPPLP